MNVRLLQCIALGTLLLAGNALAQSAPPPASSIPPPPDLDEPVQAGSSGMPSVQAQHLVLPSRASSTPAASIQPVIPPHDPMGQPPPKVDVRKVKGDVVEEYRVGGRLTMIRIIPEHGPVQTFYADPQGRLHPNADQGPVKPVFYTLYQWGH